MPQIVNIAIISTHAPAGGATIIAECEEQGIQFLLTPLREGRHMMRLSSTGGSLISTHAPAGGATQAHPNNFVP